MTLVNSCPFGTPTISSTMPVSCSHSSLTEGAPSGNGWVICPMDPSDRPSTIRAGALPAAFSALAASIARPSGVSGPY